MRRLDIKSIISSYFLKLILAYAVVFAFQFYLLYPLHNSMDLPLWDESDYMGWGRNFALGMGKLGSLAGSPAYILLYSIFSRLFGTIASIFFMRYFVTISVTLLVFTFLIQNLRSFLIAVLLSFLWVISSYNIYAGIMVYHSAVLTFILVLIYCNKSRLISILLLLLCVFMRLEYIFILIPYFIYSIVLFIFKNRQIKIPLAFKSKSRSILSLVAPLILSTTLIYIYIST